MKVRVAYSLGILVVLALIFQFFLRYQYIHQNTSETIRVDRLTQSTCILPCLPVALATPSPAPTQENMTASDNDAIQLVKTVGAIGPVLPNYEWNVRGHYTNDYSEDNELSCYAAGASPCPKIATPTPNSYPIRLVCYCGKDGSGYYFEAHLDTRRVYTVSGNRVLERQFGLDAK